MTARYLELRRRGGGRGRRARLQPSIPIGLRGITIENFRGIDTLELTFLDAFGSASDIAVLGVPVYAPEREKEVLWRAEQTSEGPLEGVAVRRLFERIIDESRRVEREAGERDLASGIDLRNQIKRLAYDDQLLLHLYYALDLPGREVAQVLGIRMGAVKSRLHRVTRRLRSQLATAEVTS